MVPFSGARIGSLFIAFETHSLGHYLQRFRARTDTNMHANADLVNNVRALSHATSLHSKYIYVSVCVVGVCVCATHVRLEMLMRAFDPSFGYCFSIAVVVVVGKYNTSILLEPFYPRSGEPMSLWHITHINKFAFYILCIFLQVTRTATQPDVHHTTPHHTTSHHNHAKRDGAA